MKVEPDKAETNVALMQCPFCGNKMDFILQDSFAEGLTFRCNLCKRKVYITNDE